MEAKTIMMQHARCVIGHIDADNRDGENKKKEFISPQKEDNVVNVIHRGNTNRKPEEVIGRELKGE